MRCFSLLALLSLSLILIWCWSTNPVEDNSLSVKEDNWWFYLSENECYEPLGNIKENPDKDEEGRIINCYDQNAEQHWVIINKYASQWTKEHEGCYNHWENVWRDIWYYKNWNIKSDKYYHDWNYVSATYYYENWQLDKKTFTKDWNPDWNWEMYYDNWKLKIKWSFVDWKSNGTWLYYYEDWTLMDEEVYNMDNLVSAKYYDKQWNEIDEETFNAMRQ